MRAIFLFSPSLPSRAIKRTPMQKHQRIGGVWFGAVRVLAVNYLPPKRYCTMPRKVLIRYRPQLLWRVQKWPPSLLRYNWQMLGKAGGWGRLHSTAQSICRHCALVCKKGGRMPRERTFRELRSWTCQCPRRRWVAIMPSME